MRGIAVRDELTEEWKKRGVKEQKEYAILTAEISEATFGMTPAEYKNFKELEKPNKNLRDRRRAISRQLTAVSLLRGIPPTAPKMQPSSCSPVGRSTFFLRGLR